MKRDEVGSRAATRRRVAILGVVAMATAGIGAQPPASPTPDRDAAQTLIEEAQGRYGRLPIGPASLELYREFADGYGFSDASFVELCVGLVAASLARATSAASLEDEFHRTLGFRDGLLPVYSPLARKWGLDGSATPALMDSAITDVDERRLFKTALLADTIATIWSFVLGYQYFKLYGESPSQPPPGQTPIAQPQVDQRLRTLAAESP